MEQNNINSRNRRIRNRTYGGVRGNGGDPVTLIYASIITRIIEVKGYTINTTNMLGVLKIVEKSNRIKINFDNNFMIRKRTLEM